MPTKDPFEALQVSKNAESEIIEAAYKRLARKYHPDYNTNPEATEKMKEINWAYDILKDPIKRKQYQNLFNNDTLRHEPVTTQTTYPRSGGNRTTYSTSTSNTNRAAQDFGTQSTTNNKKTHRTIPIYQLLLLGVFLFFVIICFINNLITDKKSENSSISNHTSAINYPTKKSSIIIPTSTKYIIATRTSMYIPTSVTDDECISYNQAEYYYGEDVCLIGKILRVDHYFDEYSEADVWTAYFSTSPNTLRIIGVDYDLTYYSGACVQVFAKISEKNLEYDVSPSIVYIDWEPQPNFLIFPIAARYCE